MEVITSVWPYTFSGSCHVGTALLDPLQDQPCDKSAVIDTDLLHVYTDTDMICVAAPRTEHVSG